MELVVGRIGRAHGIRGQVTVDVRTDDPELRLGPGARLRTDPADRGPLTFAQVRPRLKHDKGGAYCSTNWYVLHDERGMRNEIRHCDDRRHIDIN